MVTRTYIDKSNTILRYTESGKNSFDNFGLNPISMLNYGGINSRALLHFDLDKLRSMVDDGTYPEYANFKHTLKMTNCGSISPKDFYEYLSSPEVGGVKQRATSFEIIAVKIPCSWDAGVGFDYTNDFFITGGISISTDGSNWVNCKSEISWPDNGVYSDEVLNHEYAQYSKGEGSDIIVASQKFDFGNEDIELDITDYVNSVIVGGKNNYGLMLMYAPYLEESSPNITSYTGFFNNNTNTFFKPYVETRYNSPVKNDRHNFKTGKINRLYLFLYKDGVLTDSEELPVCEIDSQAWPVVRQRRGVYYATVKLSIGQYQKEDLVYDEWSNIVIDGEDVGTVEQCFEIKGSSISFEPHEEKTLTCVLTNLNDSARFLPDGSLGVNAIFRYAYTKQLSETVTNPEYRIYVYDGEREVTVVDWDTIDRIDCENNKFTIDFSEFQPHKYYIDIRVKDNSKEVLFKENGVFVIENEVTKRRH